MSRGTACPLRLHAYAQRSLTSACTSLQSSAKLFVGGQGSKASSGDVDAGYLCSLVGNADYLIWYLILQTNNGYTGGYLL